MRSFRSRTTACATRSTAATRTCKRCIASTPWSPSGDDHEIANNAWRGGAENHDDSEGDYEQRKAIAERVYREWMPIRETAPGIIYRSFAYGELVSLVMLDTRIVGRDEQSETATDTETLMDPSRQLLGAAQEAWLEQQLAASTARWKLVGQQVILGHTYIGGGLTFNTDQWDGYEAARSRFFDIVENTSSTNVVVLTGDIHSSWAMDLARDPFSTMYDPQTGGGSLGVEIVCPSVTTTGFTGFQLNAIQGLVAENPHLHWLDGVEHGYVVLDITSERVQATWWHVDDVKNAAAGAEVPVAVYTTFDGTNHLVAEGAPADPPTDAPPLAP